MDKKVKYVIIASYISIMTLIAMWAYSTERMVTGVIFEILILITIIPSWYLVNLKSEFDNNNAYLSFPYHVITYICNVSISLGFYLGGNVGYEIIVWKALLWLPFLIFHGVGYALDYKRRFKNVKFD